MRRVEATMLQAQSVKVELVSRGMPDLAPYINVYRDHDEVARVYLSAMDDTRELIELAADAAWGFDASALSVAFESWKTEGRINPRTGQPWTGAEFSAAIDDPDMIRSGAITEALMVVDVDRELEVWMAEANIRRLPDGVAWDETVVTDGREYRGRLPAAMRELMRRPSASYMDRDKEVLALIGLGPEEARASLDCAAADSLMVKDDRVGVVLMHRPEEWRRASLFRSFARQRASVSVSATRTRSALQ